MYEFMKQFVIAGAFGIILAIDAFGIGYLVVGFVRWVKKKLHPDKTE